MFDQELHTWGWAALLLYVGIMIGAGFVGMKRVRNSDDFATARGSYGPWFLSFALVATTASGATFLGIPGIAYREGLAGLWYAFIYPFGVYTGIVICARVVGRAGDTFGTRSIPEYLGDRFQSDFLRLAAALFSLLLLFYLAAQLLAGGVMFQQILGVPEFPALAITSGVLLLYIALGGAHADILTDGIQGALMIAITFIVVAMFLAGYGIEGGVNGVVDRLRELDPDNVRLFNPGSFVVGSWWAVFAIWFAHIPLGMLPHIGNKLWALDSATNRRKFLTITFVLGVIVPALALGGLLARAVLGDELLAAGQSPNNAIPALFVALLPTWAAALLGAGVLAAIMSTADGLAVSASQIFANDIYRRTLARDHPAAEVDRVALVIGRVATVFVLVLGVAMAWALRTTNIAIIVWLGIGGMTAALTGPLVLGAIWSGVTRAAAIAGFVTGGLVFAAASLVAVLIGRQHLDYGDLNLTFQNPFMRATVGGFASAIVTLFVSSVSQPLSHAHIARVFGPVEHDQRADAD